MYTHSNIVVLSLQFSEKVVNLGRELFVRQIGIRQNGTPQIDLKARPTWFFRCSG